jgi:predicted amidohydrolase
MTHPLNLAAIRMDAAPASVESRLARAKSLIVRAARQGAQIAVLPELFNTGYIYSPQNYLLVETMDGETVSWMKDSARQHKLYIAGTLLLRDADNIYNAMLLVAPDGRVWRYDKSYPWAWERAYFCPRTNPIQVAETDFGKIGMLICWDVAHVGLWAQYAGKVDLMLVSSCPPLGHQFNFHLPDSRSVKTSELGMLLKTAYRNAEKTFGELFLNQARWLGVPSVNTTGAGMFQSHLPRPVISLVSFFALRPDLWKYIPQAEQVTVSAGYFDETFVADANGNILGRTKQDGDDLVVSAVQLSDTTPKPNQPQPAFGLNVLAYILDNFSDAVLRSYYNKNWK